MSNQESLTPISTSELSRDQDLELIKQATIKAAIASMQVVRHYQTNPEAVQHLKDKGDKSVLTAVDLESEQAGLAVLKANHPDVSVLGEESGLHSSSESSLLFMLDPLDGTRPFIVGAPTSTVISSLYDKTSMRLVAASIGEPATGRLWYADGNRTLRSRVDFSESPAATSEATECRVWEGSIHDNATVLVENFAAFARAEGKRPILKNENSIRLFIALQSQVGIQNYGSNGLHHALVANGGNRLAGSITTSMGGEWDASGALCVINAGGVAEGLRMTPNRTLVSANPLNPFDYDILVTANNQESLDFLKQSLLESI